MKESILERIKKANKAYAIGNPIMSDDEYDKLRAKVRASGEEINTKPVTVSTTIRHTAPMLSMRDTFTVEETLEVLPNSSGYIVEGKLDGASMEVKYVDGKLSTAATGGDSINGEIIHYPNVINGVPDMINIGSEVAMRGEVIISKDNFKEFNKDSGYSNARNLVAGRMRTKKKDKLEEIKADFIPWEIIVGGATLSVSEMRSFIKSVGLLSNPIVIDITNKDQIEAVYVKAMHDRDKIEYELDGLAIKVASLEERSEIGETVKFPKWAVALKFPAEIIGTTVTDITSDIGRTGVYTPVCVYEPITVGGVSLTNATLHNHQNYMSLGVGIGSKIGVSRNGDVIPQVVEVYTKSDNRPILTSCVYCGAKLHIKGVDLKCSNESCSGQMTKRLVHFCSRDYMDIKGMGPAAINKLMDEGLLKTYSDIYKLKMEDMLELLGANGTTIMASIEDSKGKEIHRLLGSITIPNGGRETFNKIITADKLFKPVEELVKIRGISEITAVSINDYLTSNRDEVDLLISLVKPITPEPTLYTFAITGTFDIPRAKIGDVMLTHGYRLTKSAKADIALVGTDPSSNTVNKFVKNEVRIIKDLKDLDFIKEE